MIVESDKEVINPLSIFGNIGDEGKLNISITSKREVFLWCEDSKGGEQFWRQFCSVLFPSVIVKHNIHTVINRNSDEVGIWGNRYLFDDVVNLTDNKNLYIILYDQPYLNHNIMQEYDKLKLIVNGGYDSDTGINYTGKNNVILIDNYICLESIFFSFLHTLDWISHVKSDMPAEYLRWFKILKRYVNTRLEDDTEYRSVLNEFRNNSSVKTLKSATMEQLLASVLSLVTYGAKGFQIKKKSVGSCWWCDCCDKENSCGLDLDQIEKINRIYEHSYLKEILPDGGFLNATDL